MEGRALLQPGRRCGGHPLAATRTAAAEQSHLGHIRPDRRQLDALVDLLWRLQRVRERRRTVRAGRQSGFDHPIRVRMKHPTHPGATLAGRAIGGGAIRLLSLRGRLGRIVGSFRRAGQFVEPRFQRRDAGVLRRDPRLGDSQLTQ